jgi:hypothetical protein
MYFRIFIDFTRNNLKFLSPDRRAKEARVEVTKFLMSPGTPALVLSTDLKIDTLITDGMVARFLELEPPMNTVISEFQDIINEIERAYVLGMFFSATSAAAVSIERMLNLARMELHLHHPKKIKDLWRKGPLNEWYGNIDALKFWGYIDDDFAAELTDIYEEIRCRYLHSGEIKDLQADALRAARAAYRLISTLIGFPSDLFQIEAGALKCLNEADPRFLALYAKHRHDEPPA